jgi:hypothetical protein
MTAADVKALEAAASHAWGIVDAFRDECIRLIAINKQQRDHLIAQGDKADPMARAVVIANSVMLERLSTVCERAFLEGSVQ